jgi:dipeptidyl aminopeptidase/acylaminoacyl peptidase
MTETTSELTAELVVDGAVPAQPVISPDGRWVAYAVAPTGKRGERRLSALWLAAADGSTPPRQLTAGTAADSAPRWAPDSASLFFVSDRTGSAQVHRIRPDGGEAETLTTWKGVISGTCPLAGGQLAAVAATGEPTEEELRRRADRDDALVWADRVPPSRLWLLDLGARELTVVGGLGGRHVVEVAQRPGGGPLAVISWATPEIDPGVTTNELHLIDPQTGAVHDLGQAGRDANSLAWWQAGDGWHLAYLGMPELVGSAAVYDVLLPAAGSAAQHRILTGGMTACPTELAPAGGGPPVALFADGLDTAVCRLDPGQQRFQCLSVLDGLADSLTVSDSGEMAAARVSTSYEPADVHAGPPGGPLLRLSDTRPALRQISWGTQQRLSYPAADGLRLEGLLILPPGQSRADGGFPLITWVHGGPYGRFDDSLMLHPHAPGQWLAAAGYAVFLPNPRGSQGHGHDFAAAVAGDIGGAEWSDITSGIDLLVAAGVADPGRLGIAGGSPGGFMVAWAVGQTDRFRAALMSAGISDWGMLVATGEAGTLEAALGGSCGWEGTGPHPHDQVSPVSFASKVRTPVLIVHGEDDTNVPLGQAIFFHRALSQFGTEHELVVYPREGHGFAERNHQLDLLRRTRAWFDRWLGDPGQDAVHPRTYSRR